jgi:hypothetical protein
VNLFPVDRINNSAAIRREISVDRVRQNIRQHNHIRMLAIDLIDHVEIEEMAETQISRLIRFEQVKRQGLKKQPAVKNITRPDVVFVALH